MESRLVIKDLEGVVTTEMLLSIGFEKKHIGIHTLEEMLEKRLSRSGLFYGKGFSCELIFYLGKFSVGAFDEGETFFPCVVHNDHEYGFVSFNDLIIYLYLFKKDVYDELFDNDISLDGISFKRYFTKTL